MRAYPWFGEAWATGLGMGRALSLLALLVPSLLCGQSTVPVITSATSLSGTVGVPLNYTITATHSPNQYAATGLPAGFTCDLGTGVISGTAASAGSFSFTVAATNPSGTGTASVTLFVSPPGAPVIQSPASAAGIVGAPFEYSPWATNSPTSYDAVGLPPGLWFNSASGIIRGTPSAAGIFPVRFSATNASGTGSITLTISIVAGTAPVITSPTRATATAGSPFTFQITTTGNPAPNSFSATGLPDGLGVNAFTGQIGGRPAAAGVYVVTLAAETTSGRGTATLELTVTPPAPVVEADNTIVVTYGVAFTYTITAENAPTSFGATGLPAGLTLNTATGVITGTVTTFTNSNVTLSATNAYGTGTKQVSFSIMVPPSGAPTITSWGFHSAWVGVPFTHTLTTSTPATSYSADRLPPGLTLNPSTGVISGTPTLAGTFVGSVSATNAAGGATSSFSVTVRGAPTIEPQTVNTTSGHALTYHIAATGSPAAYTATALPAGLSFDGSSGRISGAATVTGTFTVAVTATNPAGTGSGTLTFVVAAGGVPVITSAGTATARFGDPFTYRITAANAPTWYDFVLPDGGLPLNLEINHTTGELTARAIGASGTFDLTLRATNAAGTGTKILRLSIPHTAHTVMPPLNNIYRLGRNLQFFVRFSTGVNIVGTPRIPLTIGSTTRYATARSADVAAHQVFFSYQVQAGDVDLDGISVGRAIELNGGQILTAATGEPVALDLVPVSTPYVMVDATPYPTDQPPVITAGTTFTRSSDTGFVYVVYTTGGLPTTYTVTGAPMWIESHNAQPIVQAVGLPPGNYTVTFTVTASNAAGSDSKTVTLTVTTTTLAPQITSPSTAEAIVGAPFTYAITTDTAGGTPVSYSAPGAPAWLVLDPVTGVLRGTPTGTGVTNFNVTASNFGGIDTRAVTLTAVTATRPVIIAEPESGTALHSSTVSLSVSALGVAPLSYQWRKNGARIAGATQSTLTFPSIQTGDAAWYSVVVTNSFGSATSRGIQLTVSPGVQFTPPRAPVITGAPESQTATEGEAVNFSVNVIGNEPLSYQWRKNGIPISHANRATFTLYNVSVGDAGNYEVAVVNPYGGVTSAPVTLTVNPATPTNPVPVATWLSQDVGSVSPAGGSTVSGSTVAVRGSGADIWDTTDAFHFRYQTLTGDGEIVARITTLDNTHAWAKGGLMIRESLAPNARNALVFVNPLFMAEFQYRTTAGGTTTPTGSHYLWNPRWLKLVRAGSALSAFHSADGVSWTPLSSVTLALPSTVYVGLAVTSHRPGMLANATFDNIALTGAAAPPVPPPPALPAPSALAATPVSTSAIALTWSDNSTTETGFEVQMSTDNVNFLSVMSAAANATSATRTGLSAATPYYFRVRAIDGVSGSAFSTVASATTQTAPPPPPPPASDWSSSDIGAVSANGSSSEAGGVVTVVASGEDIWGSADEFHYRYQRFTGDGEIVGRVAGLSNTHGWAKAGLMFRESLAANSRHAFMCVAATAGTAFQRRTVTGGESSSSSGVTGSTFPKWLRLVRAGNVFSGYESTDGQTWREVGVVTLELPATIHVGVAVTSHSDGRLTAATLDNVALRGGGGSTPPVADTTPAPTALTLNVMSSSAIALSWTDNSSAETGFEVQRSPDGASFAAVTTTGANVTSWLDGGLTAATTYYYRVRAVQGSGSSTFTAVANATTQSASTPPPPPPPAPATWTSNDIGVVAAVGSTSEAGGVVTLIASGEDIWNAADEFRFRYQALAGDGTIVARVTGLTNTHSWAKAGVMIRESLSSGARHAFMCVSAGNGAAFQRRVVTNGPSDSTSGAGFRPLPRWVRLARNGTTLVGSESPDGAVWTEVGRVTVELGAQVYVGLAATSHFDGTLSTATFDNVALAGWGASTGTTPPPPLPPPPPSSSGTWVQADIGSVGVAGTFSVGEASITVRGSGSDIWDSADSFHFLHRELAGDWTIEAQVSSLLNTHPWAKAGLMVRDALASGGRNVFVFLTPANGIAVQVRNTTGGLTAFTPGPWWVAAPYWVRLVRAGGVVTASTSADGDNWTVVATIPFSLGSTAQVGFGVTSHNNSTATTATFAEPFVGSAATAP